MFDDDDDETETEHEGDDDPDASAELLNSPDLTPNGSPSVAAQGSVAGRGRTRLVSGSLYRSGGGHRLSVSHGGRRFSTASGMVPAIFGNTGLRSPSIALPLDTTPRDEQDPFFASPAPTNRAGQAIGGLSVISERPGQGVETSPLISPLGGAVGEKKEATWAALPVLMIIQVSPAFLPRG